MSALLLVMAVGVGGATGISEVLAADPPALVPIAGHLADRDGTPLGGVELVVTEELPPDGGLAGFQVTTAKDGGFAVAIEPWGTTETPATLSIKAAAGQTFDVIGASCTQRFSIALSETRPLVLKGVTDPPAAVDLVADTTLVGEVCGTTASPKPKPASNAGAGSNANPTPPPTDAIPTLGDRGEQPETALLVGFAVGLAAALVFLIPRPRAGRPRR